jgi:hypothetical protein
VKEPKLILNYTRLRRLLRSARSSLLKMLWSCMTKYLAIDNNMITEDDDVISPGQRKEERLRSQFLKNSVRDMNTLYEALAPKLGDANQARRIILDL